MEEVTEQKYEKITEQKYEKITEQEQQMKTPGAASALVRSERRRPAGLPLVPARIPRAPAQRGKSILTSRPILW